MSLRSFSPDQFDQARQFLLDRRCERNHPKRHRTQKRAKGLSAAKRSRIKAKNAHIAAARQKFKEQVIAYWRGEADFHPATTSLRRRP